MAGSATPAPTALNVRSSYARRFFGDPTPAPVPRALEAGLGRLPAEPPPDMSFSGHLPQKLADQLLTPCTTTSPSPAFLTFLQELADMNVAKSNPTDRDADLLTVFNFYLKKETTLHASKTIIEKLTGVPIVKLEPLLCQLADGFLHLERHSRNTLEKACSSGTATPLLYLDLSRFDETPMVVNVKQSLTLPTGLGAGASTTSTSTVAETTGVHKPLASEFFAKTSAVCKLFATESQVAVLLKVQPASALPPPPQASIYWCRPSPSPTCSVWKETLERRYCKPCSRIWLSPRRQRTSLSGAGSPAPTRQEQIRWPNKPCYRSSGRTGWGSTPFAASMRLPSSLTAP